MKKHLLLSIAGILTLSIPSLTKAQLYVTADIGGVPIVNGATLENFDEPSPAILTLSGPAYLLTGSGVASPPSFSGSTAAYFGESPANGADASPYVGVEPGGSATLTFSTPQNYLGLLWGTIDPYGGMNVLTFYDSANNVIGTIDGGTVLSANSSLNPGDTAYVNITSTIAFSSVVATATPIFPESFEFDDVAYAPVVPEPASITLIGLALAGRFCFRRNRIG